MAGITLAAAEAKLADWLTAEEAIAERGQSYRIGERELARADLADIRTAITYWDAKVKELSRGGRRARLATPG